MARMHSRKRGEARSTRPSKRILPTWIRYKPKEVELLIVKLAKEGKSPSRIGIYLRDVYGIPDIQTLLKKKLSEVLKEKNLLKELPEDLTALIQKAALIKKHLEENKQDQSAFRGLQLTESKIKRLAKYYKRAKRLAVDWKYDPERIAMFIE